MYYVLMECFYWIIPTNKRGGKILKKKFVVLGEINHFPIIFQNYLYFFASKKFLLIDSGFYFIRDKIVLKKKLEG